MKNQKGMTLIGLILGGAVVIGLAIVGMKTAPSVMEYYSILKVLKTMNSSGDIKGASIADIRKSYDNRAYIEDIKSVTAADLDISKEGNDTVVAFEYSRKIPIVGNVSLCIDYAGSTSSSGGGN